MTTANKERELVKTADITVSSFHRSQLSFTIFFLVKNPRLQQENQVSKRRKNK